MSRPEPPLQLLLLLLTSACSPCLANTLYGLCDFETGGYCGLEGDVGMFEVSHGSPSFEYSAMDSGYSGDGYLLLDQYNIDASIHIPALSVGSQMPFVHFAYYLNGDGDYKSSLTLYQEIDGWAGQQLLWSADSHNRQWHFVNVSISVPQNAVVKVVWVAHAFRSSWSNQHSWLGLDYIEVVENSVGEGCYRPPDMPYADPWICEASQSLHSPRDQLPVNTQCTTQCQTGYTPQGSPVIVCHDGVWHEESEVPFMCLDTEPPKFISCPSDVMVVTPYGWGSTWYTAPSPEVTDNSGAWQLELYVNGQLQQSTADTTELFPGSNTFCYLATDLSHNQENCSFTVHVETADQSPPIVVKCPFSMVLETAQPTRVVWQEPVFTDDSGYIAKIEHNYAIGTVMSWGQHQVVYNAWDNSSNWAECTFNVTLKGLPCSRLSQPINGAIVCHASYAGKFCVPMCSSAGDFSLLTPELGVPKDYLCSASGFWYPYELVNDCVAEWGPEPLMADEYYFTGDCNDTETQATMKSQALYIFNHADTDATLGEQLTPDDFYVSCGPFPG